MLRSSGRDDETQWFEYRPAFNADIVRVSWDSVQWVGLGSGVLPDRLVRVGYAAPLPAGSAQKSPPPAAPSEPSAPIPAPWQTTPEKPDTETAETPPPAPSWLKNAGGDS